jgi:RNA recognition motif-containing protein
MSRKLYVGNLPYTATETALSTKFSEFGTVESIKLITDRDTGQSKGFGFVEMASDAEAKAVIDKLNGVDYEGRAMNVNEAKPKGEKSGRGGYGGGGGGYGGGGNRW